MQNFKKTALILPLFFVFFGCSTSDNQLISEDDDRVISKAVNKAAWGAEPCLRQELAKRKVSREDFSGSARYEITFGRLGGVTDVELLENNLSVPETEYCVRNALKTAQLNEFNLGGFSGVVLKYTYSL